MLPRFFTLLLLLLDKPCRLPAVAADVDRLLRLMSGRPASLQCSACYLKTCCCILVLFWSSSQASAVMYCHPLVQVFEAGTIRRYAVTLQKLVMCKLQGCSLASLCFNGMLFLAVCRTTCDAINVTSQLFCSVEFPAAMRHSHDALSLAVLCTGPSCNKSRHERHIGTQEGCH